MNQPTQKSDQKSGDNSTTLTTPAGQTASTSSSTESALVNYAFGRLQLLYGRKFDSRYSDPAELPLVKREWMIAFAEENISAKKIDKALLRCRKHHAEWPPELPIFLKFCEPTLADFDMPESDDAYQEAFHYATAMDEPKRAEHQWSHPTVYWATHKTGIWNFKHGSKDELTKAFTKHYLEYFDKVKNGVTLSVPVAQIEKQPESKCTSKQTAKEQLAKCRALLNHKTHKGNYET